MKLRTFLALFSFAIVVFLSSALTVHVTPAHAQTGCTNTPTSTDSVSATVTISQTGTYTIWSRLLTPDATNDSYYLQIDGGCAINVGDSGSIPANTWTWVNYQDGNTGSVTTQSLTAGDHTVKLIAREGNVGIDRLLFVSDTCVPTGTGDNCTYNPTATPTNTPVPTATPVVPTDTPVPATATPVSTATPTPYVDTIKPTVSITNPANGATLPRGKNVTLSANASDNIGVTKVVFTTNSGFSCTDSIPAYACVWPVPAKPNVTYTITARAYDAAGNSSANSIQVKSGK